jgi:hypothetical protein
MEFSYIGWNIKLDKPNGGIHMTKHGTIVNFPIKKENQTNKILEFIDGEQFDKVLGKVTKGLFSIILFLGIPYFFYVLIQAWFIG